MVEKGINNDYNDEYVYYLSWRYHLQEAEDGMGYGVGWFGGRSGVTLYFISIVKFYYGG